MLFFWLIQRQHYPFMVFLLWQEVIRFPSFFFLISFYSYPYFNPIHHFRHHHRFPHHRQQLIFILPIPLLEVVFILVWLPPIPISSFSWPIPILTSFFYGLPIPRVSFSFSILPTTFIFTFLLPIVFYSIHSI